MVIVCTQDNSIVSWTRNPNSGSGEWAPAKYLPQGLNQAQASTFLANNLALVKAKDPLCFSAHGNDREIGDEGIGINDWSWTAEELAVLMKKYLPQAYSGSVLIHACASSIANFSTALVLSLQDLKVFKGLWVFGYNRPVPLNESYPPPAALWKNASLQGAQVRW